VREVLDISYSFSICYLLRYIRRLCRYKYRIENRALLWPAEAESPLHVISRSLAIGS